MTWGIPEGETTGSPQGPRIPTVGSSLSPRSADYFNARWRVRQAEGWSLERFVREYNASHGTSFGVSDLKTSTGTAYGSQQHFAERWAVRKAEGWTVERFIKSYNSIYGTSLGAPDLKKAATPDPDDPATLGAKQALKVFFSNYGLPSSLVDWAYEQLQAGLRVEDIYLLAQDTKEWKTRFSGNELRLKNGLPVLSPDRYLALESAYGSIFRQAGLPSGMFDAPDDFAKYIAVDVSPEEMSSRVEFGTRRLRDVPKEVRTALNQFYGIGDSEILAFVLDPKKALDHIDKRIRAAELAGSAAIAGLQVSRARAEEISGQTGVGLEESKEAYGSISEEMRAAREGALFTPGISQSELEEAVFFGRTDALEAIRKRAQRALGEVQRGAGGALMTERGTTGLATE